MKTPLFKIILSSLFAVSALPSPTFSNETVIEETEQVHPVVIVGGGVGALTSAVYLGRAGITPLVIEGKTPGGAIAQSHSVQNWPGELEIPGWELIEKIHKQAEVNGSQFRSEEVVNIDFSERPFTITTKDLYEDDKLNYIQAQSIILAMGTTPNYLGVPGEEKHWGIGVSNCAVCDGSLYKGKTVAVVGGGDAAILETQYLSHIANEVHLFVRKDNFRTVEEHRKNEVLAKPNVKVHYLTVIKEVKGDGDKVTHVVARNVQTHEHEEIAVDGVFLAIGSKPNSQLFKNVLEMDENGYIILKKDQETSIPGVYAIGDIVDPRYKQAISAAGDGAKAAMQAEKYISSTPKTTFSQSSLKEKKHKAVIEIKSMEHFEREIRESTVPVFVDFYASWCGPCKQVAPAFETAANTFNGKIKFLKVNVDNLQDVSHLYNIKSMPTLLIFDKGEVLDRKKGSLEIFKVINRLEKFQSLTSFNIEDIIKKKS